MGAQVHLNLEWRGLKRAIHVTRRGRRGAKQVRGRRAAAGAGHGHPLRAARRAGEESGRGAPVQAGAGRAGAGRRRARRRA